MQCTTYKYTNKKKANSTKRNRCLKCYSKTSGAPLEQQQHEQNHHQSVAEGRRRRSRFVDKNSQIQTKHLANSVSTQNNNVLNLMKQCKVTGPIDSRSILFSKKKGQGHDRTTSKICPLMTILLF